MKSSLDDMLFRRVTAGHDPDLADPAARKAVGEQSIGYDLVIENTGKSDMIRTAAEDLKNFLRIALHAPENGDIQKLVLKIEPGEGHKRDFVLLVRKGCIELSGRSEWGIASGLFALQRMLKQRRAPFLKPGEKIGKNRLDPLIINPNFKQGYQISLQNPRVYSTEEMLAAARAGYTAWNLIVFADDFAEAPSYPELSATKSSIEAIRTIVNQARRCSLEIYLTVYGKNYPANHPVFQRVPGMKGSRHFLQDSYSLCASSPDVHRYYQEVFRNLVSESGIRGVILLVGCEGIPHCFTCPSTSREGEISCPVCSSREPEAVVSSLVNDIAKAVKQESPETECIVWTYGLHAWCKGKGERFVSLLSQDCTFMANFDSGDTIRRGGAEGSAFDYSISNIGPSDMFLTQYRTAVQKGLRCMAKCENSVALEYHSISAIPAPGRWMKKFVRIQQSGVAGVLMGWDFRGYRGELSSELAGSAGYADPVKKLHELAIRDFGEDNKTVLFRIWSLMDRILANHPFSIESAGYFQGPFFLGSGHPLLFSQKDLITLADSYGNKGSMLVYDLSWTIPYGVTAFRKALGKMNFFGEKAIALLPKLNLHREDPYRKKCILRHRALCEVFLRMVQTAENLLEFYIVRDSLHSGPLTPVQSEEKIRQLIAIAEKERENAYLALNALQRDPLIGHSCNYTDGISVNRYRLKLQHLDKLIHTDLPLFHYRECFNRERNPFWIHAD